MTLDFAALLDIMLKIMLGFGSLAGCTSLVAVLVNLLKLLPITFDPAKVAGILNLVTFVALVLLGVFRPDLALEVLDGYAGQIATILLFILGFIVQITGSKFVYERMKAARVPILNRQMRSKPAF